MLATMLSIIARADTATSGDIVSSPTAIIYYGKTSMISAIGAMVIEVLTIISATYLFWPLRRQGFTKLRTKFLAGMVLSDLILGIVGLIPNANYLAGHPLKNGTSSCNAVGFFLTSVLFTQHLWTLTIAISTYALLKFPISRFTRLLHRCWYIPPFLVWGISIIQSAAWYSAFGFAPSSGGALCYYGPGSKPYQRDLIQFIPRAFVFVTVIILYSRLFQFLRRPDTISVSESAKSTADIAHIRDREKDMQQNSRPSARRYWNKAKRAVGFRDRKGISPNGASMDEDLPPWERLHINIAGLDLEAMPIPPTAPAHRENRPPQPAPLSWKIPQDDADKNQRIQTGSTLIGSDGTRTISCDSEARKPDLIEEELADDIVVPTLGIHQSRSPSLHNSPGLDGLPSPLQLDTESSKESVPAPENKEESDEAAVQPVKGGSVTEVRNLDEPAEHGLRDFFMSNQATDTERRQAGGSDLRAEESAAAYFNRQASLLMLYFPLAYLFIFSFSLIRLLYDMITSKTNAGITIVSLWFVLSAGLVDALVYGVAEIVIRRRVRKNLPQHIAEGPRPSY